ncbi:recombinase family protein [Christensenellaceae bacterium OttesenSCG-928-K19]|nr:recombinase family protein [Christensenellaceae bacterium OttesenSCG-928-K19]
MSDLVKKNENVELEVMPSFDFALETENEQQTRIAEHRAWLKGIKHERPLPKHHYKVAVYIRYFNQTKYDDYLEVHKQQFLSTMGLCPNWEFVGFYVDEGGTAPHMESAESWSRLLQDCYEEKVDLIITQKASNVSKKSMELSFCARMLAALTKPVGIYFISEDIYTLASYYQEDLKDSFFLPTSNWQLLTDDEPKVRGPLDD